MNDVLFNVGNKEYRLKLSTRATVELEKKLGCNPVAIFGEGDTLPTVTNMVTVLHASLQRYNHGISLEKAYEIFDEWLDEGHVVTDFLQVLIDVYRASGLIPKESETEKN